MRGYEESRPRGGDRILPQTCHWRKRGKLRPSVDVGVFPQMSANEGRGASALPFAESRARKRPYGTVGMPKQRRVRVWVRRVRAVTLLAGALRLERPSSRRGRRDRFGGCDFPTFS